MSGKPKTKKAAFPPADMVPLAEKLRQSMAASIGRTIARHSYMDWILASVLHEALGISIKQGRLAVRAPPPNNYVRLLTDLMAFHRVKINIQGSFVTAFTKADAARNDLAHSLYMRGGDGKIYIQLVRGSWDLEPDVVNEKRAVTPESRLVDRAFLTEKRKDVEVGIKAAKLLDAQIRALLQALNGARRT